MADPVKLLLLGGTAEARSLADALADRTDIQVISSLAGRTLAPRLPAGDLRRGGFGGVEGMTRYLAEEHIDLIVDATHPYAATISRHAAEAADNAGIRRLLLCRPTWEPRADDRWHEARDAAQAADLAASLGNRLFLTVGRRELAPFAAHRDRYFLVRSVDPVSRQAFADGQADFIEARGPFREADELALMRRLAIDCLVCKNSGGDASYAKIAAARALRLPVVMLSRPALPAGEQVGDLGAAMSWLEDNIAGRVATARNCATFLPGSYETGETGGTKG